MRFLLLKRPRLKWIRSMQSTNPTLTPAPFHVAPHTPTYTSGEYLHIRDQPRTLRLLRLNHLHVLYHTQPVICIPATTLSFIDMTFTRQSDVRSTTTQSRQHAHYLTTPSLSLDLYPTGVVLTSFWHLVIIARALTRLTTPAHIILFTTRLGPTRHI